MSEHPHALRVPAKLVRHRMEIDGRELAFALGGAGVPLVFLHGIGLSSKAYRRCLALLPAMGFLVIAPDAPGHGRSTPAPVGTDFITRASAVERLLDELGVRRAFLMGHSMGGRGTLALTSAAPHRWLGSILIDAAAGPEWDMRAVERIALPAVAARAIADAIIDTGRDARALSPLDRTPFRRSIVDSALLRTARGLVDVARSVAAEDTKKWIADLDGSPVPIAVIHGARDMVVPISDAEQVADALGAPSWILPQGYHSWLLARPWSFARLLEEVMASTYFSAAHAVDPATCLTTQDAPVLTLTTSERAPVEPHHTRDYEWSLRRPSTIWGGDER